ncbi:hypothetical protein SUNI508_14110 [Seiridium unicorne]|uniref:Uncharacterized protein n=1 Tax=Seiridium unicorne TaxID=138068 RepID=A0ABR2UXQ9_9PEZI
MPLAQSSEIDDDFFTPVSRMIQ